MPLFGSYLFFVLGLLQLAAEFIYLNTILGAAGAGELNQDYDDDFGYDDYPHPGSHPTFFECPLGMAIRTAKCFIYCIAMDMMNPCIASFTYLSLIDLLLLLYLCEMIC